MFLNISLNGATNITVIANFENNSRERIYVELHGITRSGNNTGYVI